MPLHQSAAILDGGDDKGPAPPQPASMTGLSLTQQHQHEQPQPSRRVLATDPPVVARTKAIIAASGRPDVASLAQGVVYWPPPRPALRAAARLTTDALVSPAAAALLNSYGPTPGMPALRAALKRQLAAAGLAGYEPIVTPGVCRAVLCIFEAGWGSCRLLGGG